MGERGGWEREGAGRERAAVRGGAGRERGLGERQRETSDIYARTASAINWILSVMAL